MPGEQGASGGFHGSRLQRSADEEEPGQARTCSAHGGGGVASEEFSCSCKSQTPTSKGNLSV